MDASGQKYFRAIVPAKISDSPVSLNADASTRNTPRQKAPHVFLVAERRNSPRRSLLVECVGFGRCLLFSHPSRLFFKTSKMVNLRQQKRLAASVAGVGKRKSEYASRPRQEVWDRAARIVEWRQQDTTSNKEGRIDGCKGWDRQW